MEQLIGFINSNATLAALFPYATYMILVLLVFGLTYALKFPIKLIIKKIAVKIKNADGVRILDEKRTECLQTKLKALIMAIPFGLGILASYVMSLLHLSNSFSMTAGLAIGSSAVALYEFVSRVLTKIKNGEQITEADIKESAEEALKVTKEREVESKKIIEETIAAEKDFEKLLKEMDKKF